MSKLTVKELAARLTDQDVKEAIAARLLGSDEYTNSMEMIEQYNAISRVDKSIRERRFPPEPEWKPLRLEWEQDGAKLRLKPVEMDNRDQQGGWIKGWDDPGIRFSSGYRNGQPMVTHGDTRICHLQPADSKVEAEIVIGRIGTWSDWRAFPSESDAIAFYDKARMAVYELNKKRDCKSDLPYNKLWKIEQPWTPLIITFRENKDGQWEGQIISQDERDRAEKGTKHVGAFAGVEFLSCATPEWRYDGTTFYVRGDSRSGDLKWFYVGSESDKRKIQAAVRELNKSRGIELAQ